MGIIKIEKMINELQVILQVVLAATTLRGSLENIDYGLDVGDVGLEVLTDGEGKYIYPPPAPINVIELGLMLNEDSGLEMWAKILILIAIIAGVIAIGGGL